MVRCDAVTQWFLTWGPGTPWRSQTPILGVPNANLEYQQRLRTTAVTKWFLLYKPAVNKLLIRYTEKWSSTENDKDSHLSSLFHDGVMGRRDITAAAADRSDSRAQWRCRQMWRWHMKCQRRRRHTRSYYTTSATVARWRDAIYDQHTTRLTSSTSLHSE